MNGNAELLNFIYQNAEMGVHTLEQLVKIVKHEPLKKHLSAQRKEYDDIMTEAGKLLKENLCKEKEISALDRLKTYMMISAQTVCNRSDAHIAEMLIIGSNMGVLDATKQLKRYPHAGPEITDLMQRLLHFEENNVQRLKDFL
ncbi:MAG: hypothetical protein PHI98_07575 [Eubacteriales bacterium]|nr:hypothetical protein [Eubacteriales bacterium]